MEIKTIKQRVLWRRNCHGILMPAILLVTVLLMVIIRFNGYPLFEQVSFVQTKDEIRSQDVAKKTSPCEKILDTLDKVYNQRRKPRHSKSNVGWNGNLIFDLFEPEATCISEERFGSDSEERYDAFGDGPKFVCGVNHIAAKAKKKDCLIYSVGSNNDVRFEKAVHTHMKGCEVHTFDPTIAEDAFIGGEYAQFHAWGLGTDNGTEGISMGGLDTGVRKSFETIIRDLGHDNRTIDILKVRPASFLLYDSLRACI